MSELRLGAYGLDAALLITKRLQESLHAGVMEIDTGRRTTTIHLSIPRTAVGVIHRRRRERWISFVHENVHRRNELSAGVVSRVGQQSALLEESRRFADRVAQFVVDRAGAVSA